CPLASAPSSAASYLALGQPLGPRPPSLERLRRDSHRGLPAIAESIKGRRGVADRCYLTTVWGNQGRRRSSGNSSPTATGRGARPRVQRRRPRSPQPSSTATPPP